MELIRGIAQNVRPSADGLDLDLGGRAVRLEHIADKSLVQDGDDLIVAGEKKEAGTVAGHAYRNITRGYGARASCRSEAYSFVVALLLCAGASWYASLDRPQYLDHEIPVLLQRGIFIPLALLGALGAVIFIVIIVEKFLAAFRVNVAALETVRGTVHSLRLSDGGAAARFDIGEQPVEIDMPRKLAIADGDEIAVAGQRAGSVLLATSYRNMSRDAVGRGWTRLRSAWTLLWIGACLTLVVSGLLWPDDVDRLTVAFRLMLGSAFMVFIMMMALDRFFDWRLDQEGCRRVKAD